MPHARPVIPADMRASRESRLNNETQTDETTRMLPHSQLSNESYAARLNESERANTNSILLTILKRSHKLYAFAERSSF